MKLKTLGLDWDETVTDYPAPFAALCRSFERVFVITLNHGVTVGEAEHRLGCRVEGIECCPDEEVLAGTSHLWKADTCQRLGVDLMFDDDIDVVRACRAAGIHAIAVKPL